VKPARTFETWLKKEIKKAQASERKTRRQEQAMIKEGIQDDETIYETYMIGREISTLQCTLETFNYFKQLGQIEAKKGRTK
jgi:hypothetical protein